MPDGSTGLLPFTDLVEVEPGFRGEACARPIGPRRNPLPRRQRRRLSTAVLLLELRKLLERQHSEMMDELRRGRQLRRNEHEAGPAILRRLTAIERHLRLTETPDGTAALAAQAIGLMTQRRRRKPMSQIDLVADYIIVTTLQMGPDDESILECVRQRYPGLSRGEVAGALNAAADLMRGSGWGHPDGRSLSEMFEDIAWNVLSRAPALPEATAVIDDPSPF
jgi:hypothetical protein